MKTTLPWLAAAFILTGAALPLRADTTNAPATLFDREKIREQLKNMTPEERRAKIEALRKERAAPSKSGQPAQPVNLPANVPPRPDRLTAGGPEGRFMPLFDRVLTEAQRVSLRGAMESQRDKTRELEEKIRDARKALFAAGLTERFDEDAVRAKALEVGKLDAELAVLRAKAFAQIKPPLSAEQVEKLKNQPPFNAADPLLHTPNLKQIPSRTPRPPAGLRDEHDLPAPPKPEK